METTVQFGTGYPYVTGRNAVARRTVRIDVCAISRCGGAFLCLANELRALCTEVDFLGQNLAHEIALACKTDGFRQHGWKDLGRVTLFMLLEQAPCHLQMPKLIIEKPFPDCLDARIGFLLDAAVI